MERLNNPPVLGEERQRRVIASPRGIPMVQSCQGRHPARFQLCEDQLEEEEEIAVGHSNVKTHGTVCCEQEQTIGFFAMSLSEQLTKV